MTQDVDKAADTKTLVVGLGKTGLSSARYLRAQGVDLAVTDSRSNPPGLKRIRAEMPDVALFLGGFDEAVFAAADRLVVSPGVPVHQAQVAMAAARGAEILGDIELFARAAEAPIAAITGSNGKSTVTTLLGQMARLSGVNAAIGGNLGEPALDLLDARSELYVLELSSFQLETTHSMRPLVATVLNVSPDHMDRYRDLDAYAAVKARILNGAGTAVLNRDDPRVAAMAGIGDADRGFGLHRPEMPGDFGLVEQGGEAWLARGSEPLIPRSEVVIAGRHNLANALAALAMGDACGLPVAPMLETLRNFRGLPHRTLLVAERRGVSWYDDSKGTNPGATVAALEGLRGPAGGARVVLIAGGDCKGADFTPLAVAVKRTARAVILIGRDAPLIEREMHATVPLLRAQSMKDAVQLAAEVAMTGDAVLLSPACASFDMFDDYEHRGRVFMDAVEGLSP